MIALILGFASATCSDFPGEVSMDGEVMFSVEAIVKVN